MGRDGRRVTKEKKEKKFLRGSQEEDRISGLGKGIHFSLFLRVGVRLEIEEWKGIKEPIVAS